MNNQSKQSIITISTGRTERVLKKICGKHGISCVVTGTDYIDKVLTKTKSRLLCIEVGPASVPSDFVLTLCRKHKGIICVVFDKQLDTGKAAEYIKAGAFDCLGPDFTKKTIELTVIKSLAYSEKNEDSNKVINELEDSSVHLQEKNTVLETILDILSHDTKNQFVNLKCLIEQVHDTCLRSMLTEVVTDLFDSIMESVGYLGAKKRIVAVVRLIKDLKITEKRINLSSSKRIELSHESGYLYFTETTNLIKNALLNIIENALKYSPESSKITITISKDDEFIDISIADKGPGIPAADKMRVLKRGYRRTSTKTKEGSGRGLWIAQNIIRKEGGRLKISDNRGGGTVFTVTIPAFHIENIDMGIDNMCDWFGVPREAVQNKFENVETLLVLALKQPVYDFQSIIFANVVEHFRVQKAEKTERHFSNKLIQLKEKNPEGKTVLIVDDSPYVHYYLGYELTRLGYKIAAFAKNGMEGISYYNKSRPDIVTMDITMPVMGGVESAKRIIQADRAARILFISGLGDHSGIKQNLGTCLNGSNYSFLSKPFSLEDLSIELQKLTENTKQVK